MYKETRTLLEKKIKSSKGIKTEKKEELLDILKQLDKEVGELAQTDNEQAETIVNFASASTHEASKESTDKTLLELSLQGLTKSIEGFEVSHPALTKVVNHLSSLLSSMGI